MFPVIHVSVELSGCGDRKDSDDSVIIGGIIGFSRAGRLRVLRLERWNRTVGVGLKE